MKIQPALLFTALFTLVLFSCSDNTKRVLIMASGKVSVNKNNITLKAGTTHTEEYITIFDDNIQVNGPDGQQTIALSEGGGLYIINLKNDTLVGSYQRVGTDDSQKKLSRAELKMQLDSLAELQLGKNVSPEKRNYWIPPYTAKKITENKLADIYGPFSSIPATLSPGKEYEIYKFYTNKGVNEIIEKLKPLAVEELTEQ